MIVFIIPLKSPRSSKSWQKTCRLFERCVRSTCAQISPNFKVIVVCNEIPKIDFTHPNIVYEMVDFEPPEKVEHPVIRGDTDKGRRILKGIFCARQYSPSHVMVVDADDCISNRLAEFVGQHVNANGWYIRKGYKYIDGDQYIYTKPRGFYRMCGTSNILNFERLEMPEVPQYNRGYGYYKFYIDHRKVKEIMGQRGYPIRALPFSGATYILSAGDNLSENENNLSFNFLLRRKLNDRLRREFSIY